MLGFRGPRAATGVVAATVLSLQVLGLCACGRQAADGAGTAGGSPVTENGDAGGREPIPASELKVGDPAPLFSLVGSDGRTYNLADYRGKQAVVLAWFAKAFSEA